MSTQPDGDPEALALGAPEGSDPYLEAMSKLPEGFEPAMPQRKSSAPVPEQSEEALTLRERERFADGGLFRQTPPLVMPEDVGE